MEPEPASDSVIASNDVAGPTISPSPSAGSSYSSPHSLRGKANLNVFVLVYLAHSMKLQSAYYEHPTENECLIVCTFILHSMNTAEKCILWTTLNCILWTRAHIMHFFKKSPVDTMEVGGDTMHFNVDTMNKKYILLTFLTC